MVSPTPTADPSGAQFSLKFGNRIADLLTRFFVSMGFALGIGGHEVSPSRHQFLLFLARPGAFDDRLGLQVPPLTTLGHTQPPGFVRTRSALVFPG
jgi:hypothetical protein